MSKVFLLSKHPSSCHRVIFLKCKTFHFTHLFKIPQWHPLTYRIKSDRLRMTQAPWWYRNSPFLKYEYLFYTPSLLILQWRYIFQYVDALNINFFNVSCTCPSQYSGLRHKNSYSSFKNCDPILKKVYLRWVSTLFFVLPSYHMIHSLVW